MSVLRFQPPVKAGACWPFFWAIACSGGVDVTSVNVYGGDGAVDASPARQPLAEPCELVAGGPYWLTEGEPLAVLLACSTEVELGQREVEFTNLPAGAVYDSGSRVLRWTPGLDQAAVYSIEIELPESDELSTFRVGVADAHDHPENLPVVDPSRYPEEYGLPVFFLDPAPTESAYRNVSITYRGRQYLAEAKLRGSSSLAYPQKNYTLKFRNSDRFNAPDLGMGFVDRRKMVLTSTFDDNTFIRQRLAFELWDRMDPEHLQIHSASAVLYIDGRYHGLYTVTDHVDRHLMGNLGLLETGNLYKARSYDANFRVKDPIHLGVEKSEGFSEGDYSDFWQLVTFIDQSSDAEFYSSMGKWLDLRDYRDWWVFVTIIRAEDSACKNSYHYLEYPGAAARYAPWDFNASFGQDWTSRRLAPNRVPTYANWNRIFERLLESPEQAALLERRQEALDGVFSPDRVEAMIDDYFDEIEPSARRDWKRWRSDYQEFWRWEDRQDFTSIDEELDYVRSWYRERWATLKRYGTEAASE